MSRFSRLVCVQNACSTIAVVVSVFGLAYHSVGSKYSRKCAPNTSSLNCYSHCHENTSQGKVYTPEEVQLMDGTNGKPFWVSYRGEVFDLTSFKAVHPGGKLIEQTAGKVNNWYSLYSSIRLILFIFDIIKLELIRRWGR